MTSVVRAAILDLRSIAPYRRQLVIVLAVLAVVGFLLNPPNRVLAMIAIYSVLIGGYPFAMADRYDLDTLFAVLPLRRRVVLLGHYMTAVAVYLLLTAVGWLLVLGVAVVRSVAFDTAGTGVLVAFSWMVFAVFVALQFPLFVRLGYTRARLVANLPIFVLVAGGALVAPRLHGVHLSGAVAVTVAVLAGVVVLGGSFAVSLFVDSRRTGGARLR